MKTVLAENLDLVNPVSHDRFEMVLKQSGPIVLKESDWARDQNPRVFEHMVICDNLKEAIALTGILVEGSPDVRVSATIDGESILKDAPIARVSPAEFPDGLLPGEPGRTDLFRAETPERTQVGFFLPNGTRVQVYVAAPSSALVMVTLGTALYTSKVQSRPKETRESKGR